jgi:hypothetical protein
MQPNSTPEYTQKNKHYVLLSFPQYEREVMADLPLSWVEQAKVLQARPAVH